MKITIIDYGLSNLLSVQRAFLHFGATVEITSSRRKVLDAQALVLPGVGAFKDGMQRLTDLSLVDAIRQKCEEGTPLLGICLGMQMLFDESDEFGTHPGLSLIPGRVEQIPPTDIQGETQPIPNIGWHALQMHKESSILNKIKGEVYFVHSYEAKPEPAHNVASICYGGRNICAVVQKDNVTGCQFHPEKSGTVGLSILQNYLQTCTF